MLKQGRARPIQWLFTVVLLVYGLWALGVALAPSVWLREGFNPDWFHPSAIWLVWVAVATLWMPLQGRRQHRDLRGLVVVVSLLLLPLLFPGLRPASIDTSVFLKLLWPAMPVAWPMGLILVWLAGFVTISIWPSRISYWAISILSYLLMVAAAFGVAGNYLKLDLIYAQPLFATVSLPIAALLFVLSVILILRCYALRALSDLGKEREDQLINSIGLAMLVLIAFSTGLASFITVQSQVESSLYQHVSLVMNNRSIIFQNAIEAAYLDNSALGRDQEIIQLLEAIDRKPTDQNRQQLLERARALLPYGVSTFEFRSPYGILFAKSGTFEPAFTIWTEFRDKAEIRMKWREGQPFIELHLRIDGSNHDKIGELVLEMQARAWEQLFSDTFDLGRTGDMMICGVDAGIISCLDSRQRKSLWHPQERDGFYAVIQDAFEGGKNLLGSPLIARDQRGKTSVVTYTPIGKVEMALHIAGNGLAMLVKMDAEEFYEPVKQQLHRVLPLLLIIIVIGSFFLRRLVVPLVKALRDKEARYRELTALSSDSYWQMDEQLKFSEMTGIGLVNSGIDVEEWLGRTIEEVPAELESSNAISELTHQLRLQQPFYEAVFKVLNPDSSEPHYLSLSGAPLFDDAGHFSGYRGVGKDITRRKLAEEGLREAQQDLEKRVIDRTSELSASNLALAGEVQDRRKAEARFRSLTELSSDWYWEMDTDYNLVQISGEVDRKGGFSASKSLGKPLWEQTWVIPEENDWDALRLLLGAKEPFYEFTLKTYDFQGNIRYLAISGQPVNDDFGVFVGFRGIGKDVTEKRLSEERIHFLAHYDALTHLPNRALLSEHVRFAIDRARRTNQRLALLFIDLDRFKVINDSLGHDAGDQVLRVVAQRLSDSVRDCDMVSRLGGDEFVVLLEGIVDAGQASYTARRILDLINQPFRLVGDAYYVGASIGISLFPDDGDSISELLRHSDAAMYRAKEEGRNGIFFFSNTLNASTMASFRLESDLRIAVEQNQLLLHYQPKVNILKNEIVGVEALLRWQHPVRGMVSPVEFIPMAEESGLIVVIGEWVLNKALEQLAQWDRAGLPPLTMAVNLSPRQLQDSLPAILEAALTRHGVVSDRLELELTESLILQRPERDIRLLESIQQTGIRIALDDFGTGFSSLSSLATLPINCVKMDRAFVNNLPHDKTSVAISRSILTMAQGIGLEVVAEGVENIEQWDWLAQEGCHQIQGFYFSKPLPPDVAFNFISEFSRKPKP